MGRLPRRVGLLLLAAVALGAAGWLLWRGAGQPPTPAVGGDSADAPALAGATPAAEAVASPVEPAATAAPAVPRAEIAGPAAVASPPPGATDAIEIRIVDGESLEPVADAEVFAGADLDVASLDAAGREYLARLALDHEVLVRTLGGRVACDARGVVRLPRPKMLAGVVARQGDRYGALFLSSWAPGPHVLELRADVSLRIRVVDHEGASVAGLPLCSVARRAGQRRLAQQLGETDSDGALVVVHAQQRLLRELEDDAVEVAADLPGLWRRGVDVPAALPSGGVLRLELPPTGTIEAVLPAADGEGWAILADDRDWRVAAAGGVAAFARVPLGEPWQVRGSVEGWPLAAREVRGPTRSGETVRVELAREARPSLRGRVVDEAGAPVAGVELRGRLLPVGGDALATTGDAGEVELVFRGEVVGQPVEALLLEELRETAPTARRARVPLGAPLSLEPTALGTVVLRATRPLLRGRVVDDRGTGVRAGVAVQVLGRDGAGDGESWREVTELASRCDQDGAFEVYGEPDGRALRLLARAWTYLPPPPLPCAPHQSDLRIVLTRGGTVAAAVLLDPRVPTLWLSATLDLEGQERGSDQGLHRIAEDRGQLAWHGLSAGEYSLAVLLRGRRPPLVEIGGIEVRQGEPTHDPSLQPIDLRGRLRVLEIAVRGPDGRPIETQNGGVFVRGEAPGLWQGDVVAAGRVALPLVEPAVDVLVSVPGYRTEILSSVATDTEVVLRPAFGVRVRLAEPLADDDAVLLLELVPEQGARYRLASPSILARASNVPHGDKTIAWREPDGTFLGAVGSPGHYRVVACRAAPGHLPRPRPDVAPGRVEVRDVGGEQAVVVALRAQ